MLGPATFRFLSVEREASAAADWNRPDWPKLWLYNMQCRKRTARKRWLAESLTQRPVQRIATIVMQ